MIKAIALGKRKPGMSFDEFVDNDSLCRSAEPLAPDGAGQCRHATEARRLVMNVGNPAVSRHSLVPKFCRIQSCTVMRGGEKCNGRLHQKFCLYN